jgi:hypothetical protein
MPPAAPHPTRGPPSCTASSPSRADSPFSSRCPTSARLKAASAVLPDHSPATCLRPSSSTVRAMLVHAPRTRAAPTRSTRCRRPSSRCPSGRHGARCRPWSSTGRGLPCGFRLFAPAVARCPRPPSPTSPPTSASNWASHALSCSPRSAGRPDDLRPASDQPRQLSPLRPGRERFPPALRTLSSPLPLAPSHGPRMLPWTRPTPAPSRADLPPQIPRRPGHRPTKEITAARRKVARIPAEPAGATGTHPGYHDICGGRQRR